MIKKFSEEFANLINHNVSRKLIQNSDTDNSDIPAEYPTMETGKLPMPPADGFIKTYCCEDDK